MTESSFRRLLFRLALLPMLSLLGLMTILGVEFKQVTLARFMGAQATTVLLQTDLLEKSVIDQETGIRGYLTGRDAAYLQPYQEASARVNAELAALQSTAAPYPDLAAKIAAISANYRHFNLINQQLVASKASEANIPLLQQQKQDMDSMRAQFADVIAEQSVIRESNRSRLTRVLGRLPIIGIGGSVLIAVLVLWYGNTLFRRITSAFLQQLNETEIRRDYFETTLRSIGDAVIVCDALGKVTLMNPAAVKVTGWALDQARDQSLETVFRIVNEDTRETVESPVNKVLRLGSVVGLANHTVLIRRDSTECPIDDSGAPIRDKNNKIVGVVLVFRDIAARRQQEEALRQSNASRLRLAAIIESAEDAIVSKDLDGIVTSWNEGASKLFGYSADEMLGRSIRRLIPDELQHEENEILGKIRAGESIEHYETKRKKKNGDIFEISVTISPIRDEVGTIIGASKIARDIENRRQVERLLLRAEKFAATGRMAATIAHEINNPLESLVNLVYIARQRSAPDSDVHGYLLTAEKELDRVSHIARQTLGFYRDTGSPTEVCLSQLIENVLAVYGSKLSTAGITIDKQFRDQRTILVRRGELLQIFSNVVTNAADAMKKGGVLTVSVRETVHALGEGVETTIRDTGSGIRQEHMAHVFEPFFTTKGDLGTGIGLWVTKQMVEGRGGEISITTSTELVNSGTVVTIFIPFAWPTDR